MDRIARDSTTVVTPVIDVINDKTFQFHHGPGIAVGGFDWDLQVPIWCLASCLFGSNLRQQSTNLWLPFNPHQCLFLSFKLSILLLVLLTSVCFIFLCSDHDFIIQMGSECKTEFAMRQTDVMITRNRAQFS